VHGRCMRLRSRSHVQPALRADLCRTATRSITNGAVHAAATPCAAHSAAHSAQHGATGQATVTQQTCSVRRIPTGAVRVLSRVTSAPCGWRRGGRRQRPTAGADGGGQRLGRWRGLMTTADGGGRRQRPTAGATAGATTTADGGGRRRGFVGDLSSKTTRLTGGTAGCAAARTGVKKYSWLVTRSCATLYKRGGRTLRHTKLSPRHTPLRDTAASARAARSVARPNECAVLIRSIDPSCACALHRIRHGGVPAGSERRSSASHTWSAELRP
jgi:hypothetical protein